MNLSKLEIEYQEALNREDFEKITEIVSIINNETLDNRKQAYNLYKQIEEDAFNRGRTVRNLDAEKLALSFKPSGGKTDPKSKKPKSGKVSKHKEAPTEKYFVNFYNRNFLVFSALTDYYLLALSNSDIPNPPVLLILCDDSNSNLPPLKSLMDKEIEGKVLQCIKHNISNLEQIFPDLKATVNYLCVLNVTPSLTDPAGLKEQIDKLAGFFEDRSILTVKKRDSTITDTDYFTENLTDDKIAEILGNSNKIFHNKILSFDEQRLIKSFFPKIMSATITYEILDRGASGAVVFEVQAVPIHMGRRKRYVIKIARKKAVGDSKLKIEMQNFELFVEDVSTAPTNYAADYKENEILEAIRYNYASADSNSDARPFAKILNEFLAGNGAEGNLLADIIASLLTCDLFINGMREKTSVTETLDKLYAPYLQSGTKVKNAIHEIADTNVNIPTLLSFYERLKAHSMTVNQKVCHGDLHTDNFFYDNKHVTLIDFGFTGMHHAVIDHALLEASIRFKHFPKYISLSELENYDTKLMDFSSFQESFNMDFIQRAKIRALYDLIYQLRLDSRQFFHDKNNPTEYLISLFLISFRQIQYPDLNQLYALRFSELLSKCIRI